MQKYIGEENTLEPIVFGSREEAYKIQREITSTYKNFVRDYVPLLKPDLVLIGVLQYEDLSQIYTNKFSSISNHFLI